MELRFTKSFAAEYKKIARGNQPLRVKISKQLSLLRENTNHPSLRLHKLVSSQYWSISVDKSIRVLILIKTDFIYLYHVGKHEDVY